MLKIDGFYTAKKINQMKPKLTSILFGVLAIAAVIAIDQPAFGQEAVQVYNSTAGINCPITGCVEGGTYLLPTSVGTFNIPYTIQGGTIQNMQILGQQTTLAITINTSSNGSLSVSIPRALIDAKALPPVTTGPNSTSTTKVNPAEMPDQSFIVQDGGQNVQFTEVKNINTRTLGISFHKGDTTIDVVGTVSISSIPLQQTLSSAVAAVVVATDKSSYAIGDTIVVSGQVQAVVPGTPLTVQILDSNTNLIQIVQVNVSPSGTFTESFLASGPSWKTGGTYIVKVQYGLPNVTAQTTFMFNALGNTINAVFPVQIPSSSQTTNVYYTISGGSINGISINPSSISMLVSLKTITDGSVTLQIPRTLIDAKTSSGQDGSFIILIDGAQVQPQNESANGDYRTLIIQFLQGDQDIEIIGTQLVSSTIPPQQIPPTISMSVSTDKSSYNAGDLVTISAYLQNAPDDQTVAILVTDPSGNVISSRTLPYSPSSNTLQVGLPQSAPSGTYKVTVTSSVSGSTKMASTLFTVTSLPSPASQVTIFSVQPTNQQGVPIPSFAKGTTEYARVILSSSSGQSALITVNLVDADSTSLGVGTVQTTLGTGQSEMIVSFYIPSDAASGTAHIYADAYSDWPSNGGTPLGGESSSVVTIG